MCTLVNKDAFDVGTIKKINYLMWVPLRNIIYNVGTIKKYNI